MIKAILFIISSALVISTLLIGCPASATDTTAQIIKDIYPQEAFDLTLQNVGNSSFVILDVRTSSEWHEGYIEGARNIDFRSATFEAELEALDRTKTYFIYCASGGRSGQALDMMEGLGFVEVYNLDGGTKAWQAAELPLVGVTGGTSGFSINDAFLTATLDGVGQPVNGVTVFSPDTPRIYLSLDISGDLTCKTLTIHWWYENEDEKIGYSWIEGAGANNEYMIPLSQPDGGFPIGYYSVEVIVETELVLQLNFGIE